MLERIDVMYHWNEDGSLGWVDMKAVIGRCMSFPDFLPNILRCLEQDSGIFKVKFVEGGSKLEVTLYNVTDVDAAIVIFKG